MERMQSVERVDDHGASIVHIEEEIAGLDRDVAALDAAMAKAAEVRSAERASNAETAEDAREAQTAVARALAALRKLEQRPRGPRGFTGKAAKVRQPHICAALQHHGVFAMLERIVLDCAWLATDTEHIEATAQSEYESFIANARVDKAAKNSDIERRTSRKRDWEQTLAAEEGDEFSLHIGTMSGELLRITSLRPGMKLVALRAHVERALQLSAHKFVMLQSGTAALGLEKMSKTLSELGIHAGTELTCIVQMIDGSALPAGRFSLSRELPDGKQEAALILCADGSAKIFAKEDGSRKYQRNEGLLGLVALAAEVLGTETILELRKDGDYTVRSAVVEGPVGRRRLTVGPWFPIVGMATLEELCVP